MVNLQFDPHDPERMLDIGRLFYALSVSLSELDKFYQELNLIRPCHAKYWPSFCQLGEVSFQYCDRLDKGHLSKLVFKARTLPDNEVIVVKFTRSYCAEAHRLLQGAKLAPRLMYFSGEDPNFKKLDGLDVVVMEFVQDEVLTDEGRKAKKKAIDLLHQANIVFEDLRLPNVLGTTKGAMLVDFDWAGKSGEVFYPPAVEH